MSNFEKRQSLQMSAANVNFTDSLGESSRTLTSLLPLGCSIKEVLAVLTKSRLILF